MAAFTASLFALVAGTVLALLMGLLVVKASGMGFLMLTLAADNGAWAVLDETVAGVQLVAMALAAVGVWWSMDSAHGHVHRHEPTVHEHEHTHPDEHHDHDHGEELVGRHSHRHSHDVVLVHEHPHVPDLHHHHPHG